MRNLFSFLSVVFGVIFLVHVIIHINNKRVYTHVIQVTFYDGSTDTVEARYYSFDKKSVKLHDGDLRIEWHKTLASHVRTYKEIK